MKKPLTKFQSKAQKNKDLPERPLQKNAPAGNSMTPDNVLMKLIRDAVLILDADFHIQNWNPGAEEIYGWKEEEVLGKISFEVFQTDPNVFSPDFIIKELTSKDFYRIESSHKTKYGETIITSTSFSAVKNENGLLTGIIFIAKDITQNKNNEIRLKDLSNNLKDLVALQTRELTSIFERVTDGFAAFDKDWNYTYMNKTGGEIFHCNPEEVIGKNLWQQFPEAIGRGFHASCLKAMDTLAYIHAEDFYPVHKRWIEFNIYPSKQGISIYFKEITEKKNAEKNLEKANRLYHFISSINQMIVRAKDQETLFRETCRIAIEIGHFKLAWIGKLDAKTKAITPLVSEGDDLGFFDTIKFYADANVPGSTGPSARVFNEGLTSISNDIANDPKILLGKEALKRGFYSAIALPIRRMDKVIANFSLYAGQPDFFDEVEIKLLEEACNDISFALDFIEKEAMRKRTQESLLKSERRYQSLTEISPVGIFHTNKEGFVTYVNKRWTTIAGINLQEALGHSWQKAIHENDRETILDAWSDAINKGSNVQFECRFKKPDNSVSWVIGQAVPEKNSANQIIGYVGTITDITTRKIADDSIKKINAQLNLSQKIARIGYWEIDLISSNNYWSDEMYRLCEIEKASVVISPEIFYQSIPSKDRDRVINLISSLVKDKKEFVSIEYPFISKDGSLRYMLSTGAIVLNDEGVPIRINGTMQDITERKYIELEIVKEKYLSDSVIDNLPGIFYLINQKGKFIRWNRNLEEVMMYDSTEIEMMNRLDLAIPEETEMIASSIRESLTSGRESVLTHFLTKKGDIIPFHLTGMTIDYKGEKCLMVMGIDFSERAHIQEEMEETSRQLQSLTDHLQTIREEERKRIGRELHDELGQQLTAMKMDISWVNKKLPDDSALIKEKMKEVISLLDGSNTALRRILNELRPTILDQHGLLDALHWHAKQFTATTHIPLEIQTTEEEIRVKDEISTCLFRIFQESLTNITRYAEANKVVTFIGTSNGEINLSIEDDGKGFDTEAEQPKSRQPFGILGMKERVRALQGKFELVSAPGKGTKINISLPLQ